MNNPNITVKALIKAPITKVWTYYTLPEHITSWNFASDDWHCPSATNELVNGGKYTSRMEAKDGSWGFDFEAIYKEVILEQKLRYELNDGRKVSILFQPVDGQVEVSITFEAEKQNTPEMQRDGWQAILNNFKKYVESK
jgi:uncharacterized protein YndB with AHSA1/START domain